MNIKTIGTFAAAALLTGSLNVAQAEDAKKPAAKKSDRPSRESIIKRFDKDGDGKLSEEERRAVGAARRKLGERQSDRASESDPRRQRIATARKQISDAMKAGKITEKQANERMEALKKRISQSNRAIDRRQGGQGGSERGERSRSRNRDSDRRGNRASDRRQGGRGGENTERRRRGNRRGGE